jgi:hypothetical protein
MVTTAKKKPTAAIDEKNGDASLAPVKLTPIRKMLVGLRIVGTTPLIQHRWGTKALQMIRDKQGGKKTKVREVRDPEFEGREAMYVTADGKSGVPAMALKSAIIGAAHKDIGIEKTLVRKGLFLKSGPDMILPMECSEPQIREDPVRVGQGSADLRYRPFFEQWAVVIECVIDADLLQVSDLVNLIDRAGFGVGIGEMRPEKGGEYGRFEVDRLCPVVTKLLNDSDSESV